MRKQPFERISKPLSILIMDFNRPDESYALLKSIKKHVKIEHEIIFLSNGGAQEYVFEFYQMGLIDKCILNKKNEGSGLGTLRLTEFCQSPYLFNIQCDHVFFRDFSQEEFNAMKEVLETPDIGSLDFTMLSYKQNGMFSERAFLCKTDFYCSNVFHEGGGTGPDQNLNLKGTENAMGEWLEFHGKRSVSWDPLMLLDIGKYAVIETPCGGILRRRCDTQELIVEKIPQKKMPLWNLSDSEWDEILSGKWENWRIPSKSEEWIFFLFGDKFENPELNSKFKEIADKNKSRLVSRSGAKKDEKSI